MASIGPVKLDIFLDNPKGSGMALVQVNYVIQQTLDDVQSGRSYRELVQLVSHAQPVEQLVSGGTVWDGLVVFTTEHVAFTRSLELRLPIASLAVGTISPFQRDPILARVTLTPLPPAAEVLDSNTVLINQERIVGSP
jgi:hypothetical protein